MRSLLLLFSLCCLAQQLSAQCNATITPLGPTTFCAPGSVTFQASPGSVYKWYKDGNYFALLVTNTLTVSASGSYVVVVDSSGCIDTSAAVTVVANTVQPQAAIITAGDTFICPGTAVTLAATMGSAYQWYLDGLPLPGADSNTHSASVAGSYTVVVDSMGCLGTSGARIITQNYIPASPVFVGGPDTICCGSTVTYSIAAVPGAMSYTWSAYNLSWSPFFGTTTSLSRTANSGCNLASTTSPTDYILVRANNVCGSSAYTARQVASFRYPNTGGSILDPDIATYSPGLLCDTLFGTLNAFTNTHIDGFTGVKQYQWSRNGSEIPGANNYLLYINRAGMYSVVVSTGNGHCPVTITKMKVSQGVPGIAIDAQAGNNVCTDGVAVLKAVVDTAGYDGNNYTWYWLQNGVGLYNSVNAPYWVASAPGEYSLRISGYLTNQWFYQAPCSTYSATFTVAQSAGAATPVSITQNGNEFTATPGFAAYQWYRNSAPIAGQTSPNCPRNTWGDYFVVATDGNGCQSKSNVVLSVADAVVGDEEWRIFPSPASAEVNVYAVLPVATGMAQLLITDVAGRVLTMHEAPIKDRKIEKAIVLDGNMPPGLYFIRITAEGYHRVSSFTKN
ncbi:MAG: T9SS type A sorting domain-containing protein [Flavipsychrobacter sp.]|nr:T9SS type A sorting domain-containing protein [Flavipsychrobacter sp.]